MEQHENLVELAFGAGGLLAQQYPGYMARPQQIEFANGIRAAMANKEIFLGEAPTGVGKSLASLVPAAEIIMKENAPVIVVTSSIVLQEQYFNEVIPQLEKVLDVSLQPVLIKGRANYLCEYKHNEQLISGTDLFNFKERKELMDWAAKTRTGDVSELDFVPKYELWSEFAALDDNECQGKRCPVFETCHYYRQRKLVMGAKLIVCNYHYFLTAIDAEGMFPGGIRAVIMDEGHEISDIAKNFQEQKYTSNSLKGLLESFYKSGRKSASVHASIDKELDINHLHNALQLDDLQTTLEGAMFNLTTFFNQHKPPDKEAWTLPHETRYGIQNMVMDHYLAMIEKKDALFIRINKYGLDSEERHRWHEVYHEDEIKWQLSLEKFFDGLRERIRFLKRYFVIEDAIRAAENIFGESDDPTATPPPSEHTKDETIIHWIQENNGGISLHVKPSMAAPLMSHILDTESRTYTPIIISATLAVGGEFRHLKEDLGIEHPTRELVVSSPFDLTNNLLWYLPQGVPAGNTREHLLFAAEEMKRIILAARGRTLCLFTSNRALIETTNFMRNNLPSNINIVAQGEYPRQKIVDMMKSDAHTVIMGTRSFFTGIDIQGQNLSAVLVDKLPFPMIGDPVNDYLMSLQSGFWNFTLPRAIVTLKQAFGRGNRTTKDKCIVSVMDGRVATSGYKVIIFNSFDFQVTATRNFDAVKEYLETILREEGEDVGFDPQARPLF